MLLLILDGLGDRPVPELGGRTPAEAAFTPNLDELARRGASGLHLPFGWGRAPSSELAHWSLFGYESFRFCGRAVLEALGAGLAVPERIPHLYAALRPSRVDHGEVWITGRATASDTADSRRLLSSLAPSVSDGIEFRLYPLVRGEAILTLTGAPTVEVTDTDPFFPHLHPWIRPLALAGAPDAVPVAGALERFLRSSREVLVAHQVNQARRRHGLPPLDVLTTKWGGVRHPLPPFADRVGCPGAAVTSSALYRGLAVLLGMTHVQPDPDPDLGADVARRLDLAVGLLAGQAAFVHVHTKAPDEAGHSKLPFAKRDALEALDAGLGPLLSLSERLVVAVTGDHATPSSGGVLHSGDPTPLVVAGPTVRPDGETSFGEQPAARGAFGVLRATDLLPLLLGYANRPRFLGHRPTTQDALALADRPTPLLLDAEADGTTPSSGAPEGPLSEEDPRPWPIS